MNIGAIQLLYGYNKWANAQLWRCMETLKASQFTQAHPYSLQSVQRHLVHMASVDARWFARVRGIAEPAILQAEDFPTKLDVWRMWDVVYDELWYALQMLTDEHLHATFSYSSRGVERQTYGWQILLHVLNHNTDHRAQILYLLHQMGLPTFEQDFIYYLREVVPSRQGVHVELPPLLSLMNYDRYGIHRLLTESLATLSDAQLDEDRGYSIPTVRGQLAHLLHAQGYWLSKLSHQPQHETLRGGHTSIYEYVAQLTNDQLMQPFEYTTASGLRVANVRWEILWQVINHGTDHRAQVLAFLHPLQAPTFEQDYMIYLWEAND
ncbi:MAG: DinB family protein [Phototrophicaceae bacterium]